MRGIERLIERLERGLIVVVAVLMSVLALLVCWQVFSRYVLHASPFWVEELVVTVMMWIGLLGAAALVWRGSHMSLELLARRLSEAARPWAEAATDVVIAAFAAFLTVQGWVLTSATMSSAMATIPIPVGVSYLVLPVSGVLMILFALARATRTLTLHIAARRARRGRPGGG
jgi:TRAP-type C4-dicarboxylate transport system permease small subunit